MAKKNQFKRKFKLFLKKAAAWGGYWIIINLALAAILIFSIGYCSRHALDKYTRHGESLELPDFEGMTEERAREVADSIGVRLEIIDSIYVMEGRGLIDHQIPKPGSHVKSGRRVMIVMRAKEVRQVIMPELKDYSTRQALAELESRGLQVGKLIYDTSTPTTNNVLKQLYKGKVIKEKVSLDAESAIDLVIGLNPDENYTMIPNVVGKKGPEAKRTIHEQYLNVELKYDKGIETYKERSRAVVYKQLPEASNFPVDMGLKITLYLRPETAEK